MKSIILWNYQRGSWQYDIFCLLIIIFIFATPKSWFNKDERLPTQTSRLIVKAQEFSNSEENLELVVKRLSGNPQAEILEVRNKLDENGHSFYEIDIR